MTFEDIDRFLCFRDYLLSSFSPFVTWTTEKQMTNWHFSSEKSMKKIEKIHERALRFLYNDSTSSYDDLLSKAGKCSMKISRLRTLNSVY